MLVLVLAGVVAVLESREPLDLVAVRWEIPDLIDDQGREPRLLFLSLGNHDLGSVWVDYPTAEAEVRVDRRWVRVELASTVGWIPRRSRQEVIVLAPPGTDACRLHFRYRREAFWWRLWRGLGPLGEALERRFPIAIQRFWAFATPLQRPPDPRSVVLQAALDPLPAENR